VQLGDMPAAVADDDRLRWADPATPGALGLPAPIRRLLDETAGRAGFQTRDLFDQDSGDNR
jgi:hypothetical protein